MINGFLTKVPTTGVMLKTIIYNISVLFRLQRVKTRAHALMQKREQPDLIDVETIRAALQA